MYHGRSTPPRRVTNTSQRMLLKSAHGHSWQVLYVQSAGRMTYDVWVWVSVCGSACVCVCVFIFLKKIKKTNIYIYIYMCIYLFTCTCTCSCLCVYVSAFHRIIRWFGVFFCLVCSNSVPFFTVVTRCQVGFYALDHSSNAFTLVTGWSAEKERTRYNTDSTSGWLRDGRSGRRQGDQDRLRHGNNEENLNERTVEIPQVQRPFTPYAMKFEDPSHEETKRQQ